MNFKNILLIFLILILPLFPSSIKAQDLTPDAGEVFRDDVIPRIDINLPADSLAWILTEQNLYSNDLFHATFIFDNGTINETIENVGFRLRGNTSRTAGKKSFKISFNTFEPGRKFFGLEKMNLNGEHNDPTIMRSKICWDIAHQFGIVGSRSNLVRLYINDEFKGVYANIEHIDEEFVGLRYGSQDGNLYKCLYPADLDYLGSDPDEYKLVVFGRQVYQLKTNTDEDDYTKLAHFIDVLNNTPPDELACELEKVFNINDYLKYIAFDILTGNWDGPIYNKNNFYLYENPLTGKIEYIPYDLDNTLGIDWLNRDWGTRNIYDWAKHNQPRPIYWNIIEVPELRDRFTYYIRKMIDDVFSENNLNPHIDALKGMIDEWREIDTYSELDYGFTFDDYNNSFTSALGNQVDYGLKEYINTRYINTITQWEQPDILPIITNVENNYPNAIQDIVVNALLEDNGTIQNVNLRYEVVGQGSLLSAEMFDDGLHDDGLAGDGIFGVTLSPLSGGGIIHYFIEAIDDAGQMNRFPKCDLITMNVGSSTHELYINEIMASNNNTIADDFGENDDWIEIYNGGADPIYLGDKFLSDKMNEPDKWQMPDVTIQPGEFLLFWADKDEMQGEYHTNFKLSSSGEFVGVFDNQANNFGRIDGVDFGALEGDEAYGRIPNGVGEFVTVEPTPEASNVPLAVDDFLGKIKINIFPNPTSNILNIIFMEKNNETWSFQLTDITGRVVVEKNEITGRNFQMNLEDKDLSEGIYFIKIKIEDVGMLSKKLIFGF